MALNPNAFDAVMGVVSSSGNGQGLPFYPDANFIPMQLGRSGEQLVGNVHGKHHQSAYRGNVFIGTSAVAGTAIPINTTTAPTCILWNASTDRLVVPIAYYAGFASGTGIAGAIGYQLLSNAGTGASGVTTTNITAFTDLTPVCGYVGRASAHARFAVAATIVTTSNITYLRSSGLSQGAPITSTASYWSLQDTTFDGTLIIPPGYALYTVANTAIAEVTQQSWVWEEVSLAGA